MPVHLLKPLLLPLLILVAVNLVAVAWRALPQDDSGGAQDGSWQTLDSSVRSLDVRARLLNGHWGQPASNPEEELDQDGNPVNAGEAPEPTVEETIEALSNHIQRQLQGIIHRGDWVLLFAQPESSIDASDTVSDTLKLPLELRSGDILPDTPWHIGQIWADRIQLLQDGNDPLIVPLYPIAESVTES